MPRAIAVCYVYQPERASSNHAKTFGNLVLLKDYRNDAVRVCEKASVSCIPCGKIKPNNLLEL